MRRGGSFRYPPPMPSGNGWLNRAGLVAGPLAGVLLFLVLPAERLNDAGEVVGGLSYGARVVAGTAVLMGIWWMTEALAIEVTGLVPLALVPALGAVPMGEVAAAYADRVIFLFLGGMLLGAAMERWDLHRRLALGVLRMCGGGGARLVGGFLVASAFISMWVSNTASAVMMLPIAVSVGQVVSRGASAGDERSLVDFRAALMLAVAYGASIGGVGTLIGTPPTAQFAAFMDREYGRPVSFAGWMLIGVPVLLVVLPAAWLVLTRVALRVRLPEGLGMREYLDGEARALGRMSREQVSVLAVFLCAGAGWVSSRWTGIPDESIAIGAALALFLLRAPASEGGAVLTWREASRVPWGVLLLFGGGLSLASCMSKTGLDRAIAGLAGGLGGVPLPVLLLVLALCAVALTEFATNTALVALALPIIASVGQSLPVDPAAALLAVTLAASLGFMLPAGTAPNALAYSTGLVSMRQMVRAGLWLDLLCAFLVPFVVMAALWLGVLPGAAAD